MNIHVYFYLNFKWPFKWCWISRTLGIHKYLEYLPEYLKGQILRCSSRQEACFACIAVVEKVSINFSKQFKYIQEKLLVMSSWTDRSKSYRQSPPGPGCTRARGPGQPSRHSLSSLPQPICQGRWSRPWSPPLKWPATGGPRLEIRSNFLIHGNWGTGLLVRLIRQKGRY